MMRRFALPDGSIVFSLDADRRDLFIVTSLNPDANSAIALNCAMAIALSSLARTSDCQPDLFHRERNGARVFAFEPRPAASECFLVNDGFNDSHAHIFECGLSGNSGHAESNFYPGNTILSGLQIGPDIDRGNSRAAFVLKYAPSAKHVRTLQAAAGGYIDSLEMNGCRD
jgi:hypothetical protein